MSFKIFGFWILSLLYFVSDVKAKCTGGKYPSNIASKYDEVIHPPKYPSKDDAREKNKPYKIEDGKKETKLPDKEGKDKQESNKPPKIGEEKNDSSMPSKLTSKEGNEKNESNKQLKNREEKQDSSMSSKNGNDLSLNVSSKHGEGKYVDDRKNPPNKPSNNKNAANDLTTPSAMPLTTTVNPNLIQIHPNSVNRPSAKHPPKDHPPSNHLSGHHLNQDKLHPGFDIEETTDKQTKCYNSCSWCHAKTTLRKVKSQKEFKRCISLCAKENQCEPEFETCLRFSDTSNGIHKCAKHWKNCAKRFCFK